MADVAEKPLEKKCEAPATTDKVNAEALECKAEPKYAPTNTADAFLTDLQLIDNGTSQTVRDAATHQPTLTGDSLREKAETLDGILHRGAWGRLWDSRDAQEVLNVVGAMSPDDLKRFEAAYNEREGSGTLRDELKQLYSGSDLRKIEAVLNKDGKATNFAGNMAIALETANDSQSDAGSQFRALFGHMSTQDMATAREQWKQQGYDKEYGEFDEAIGNSALSDVDKKLFSTFYSKDPKQRTSADIVGAAHVVIDDVTKNLGFIDPSETLRQFADILGGDSDAAIEARRALRGDSDFAARYENTFGPMSGTSSTERAMSIDYLNNGKVSLETTITGDSSVLAGWFGDPKNIEFNLAHATAKERADFLAGQLLVGKDAATMTVVQQEQLRFFNSLSDNFHANGDETQIATWTDILSNGRKTIVSDLAQKNADGKLNGETLTSAIEGMSKEDWELLRSVGGAESPLLTQLKAAVTKFAGDSPELQARLLEKIQTMSDAKTFEDAQKIKRSFEEVITANVGSDGDPKSIAAAVMSMTPEDIQKYKNDPEFRAKVDQVVFPDRIGYDSFNEYSNNSAMAARVLAAETLIRLASADGPSKMGPVEKLAQQLMNGELTEPHAAMQAMNDIMHDPQTLARMRAVNAKPEGENTVIDSNLYTLIARLDPSRMPGEGFKTLLSEENQVPIGIQILDGGGTLDGFSQYSVTGEYAVQDYEMNPDEREVRDYIQAQQGRTDFVDEARLYNLGIETGKQGFQDSVDYRDVVGKISAMTDEQRTQFFKDYQDKYHKPFADDFTAYVAAAEGLDDKHQRVFDQIKADGFKLTTATQIRLEVLDGTGNYQKFADTLNTLTPEQRLALKEEYRHNFTSDLESDFLGMIPNNFADTITYSNLLRPADVDPVQDFLNRVQNFDDSGLTPDGTLAGMLRALQINGDYVANRDKLPAEVRNAIDSYFNEAVQNNRDSKDRVNEMAQKAIDAAMLVAVAATFFESGGSSALLLGAGAGALREPVAKLIKGEGNITEAQMNSLLIQSGIDVAAFTVLPGVVSRVTKALNRMGEAGLLKGSTLITEDAAAVAKVDITAARAEAVPGEGVIASEVKAPVVSENLGEQAVKNVVTEVPAPVVTRADLAAKAAESKSVTDIKALQDFDRKALQEAVANNAATEADIAAFEERAFQELVRAGDPAAIAKAAQLEQAAAEAEALAARQALKTETQVQVEAEAVAADVDGLAARQALKTETQVQVEAEAVAADVDGLAARQRLQTQTQVQTEAELAEAKALATAEREAAQARALATAQREAEEARALAARQSEMAAQEKAIQADRVALEAQAELDAVAAAAAIKVDGVLIAPALAIDDFAQKDEPVQDFTPVAPPTALPSDALIDMATVRRGEGPWQSAERILAADGKRHSVDEVRALTKAFQAVYSAQHDGNGDMSGLKVKYNFVTKDNYDDLVAACNNDAVKAVLMGLAQGAAVS